MPVILVRLAPALPPTVKRWALATPVRAIERMSEANIFFISLCFLATSPIVMPTDVKHLI